MVILGMDTYGRKFIIAPNWYKGHRYRGKYALEYRVIAEKIIGRALKANEVVHHKDGNKRNNDESNLEIMVRNDHVKLHSRQKGLKMVEIQCPVCSKSFTRRVAHTIVNQKRYKNSYCSRQCSGKAWRKKDKSKFFENKILNHFTQKHSEVA